ncbi:hypothetical protein [Labrys sp. (in: a-proteobacteria)]|uniref:hypothetical protein n=1 Tax=Labrys sp. (in: a-proteobacteria) TaxID=1917972 RepID=UPI0039E6AF55
MTSTLVMNLGIAPPPGAKGPRLIPRTSDGFPARGITHHFGFTDAAIGAGLLDSISGQRFPVDNAAGTAQLAANGGLFLQGVRTLLGPNVDVTPPWTILFASTIAAPVAGNPALQYLKVGTFGVRGFHAFTALGANPGAADLFYAGLQRTKNGAQNGAWTNTPNPQALQYGKFGIFVVRADENWNVTLETRRGGLVSQFSEYWPINEILGPDGQHVTSQQLTLGSMLGSMDGGSATYESLSTYSVALGDDEIDMWVTSAAAIATARGRG